MTRQRALILEILQHSPKHLTADEIFAIAREKMPGIARGTVYRNLKLMEQAREIARLEMPDGPDRFDKTSNPHGHLYCDCCGSLAGPAGDRPWCAKLKKPLEPEERSYQLTILTSALNAAKTG